VCSACYSTIEQEDERIREECWREEEGNKLEEVFSRIRKFNEKGRSKGLKILMRLFDPLPGSISIGKAGIARSSRAVGKNDDREFVSSFRIIDGDRQVFVPFGVVEQDLRGRLDGIGLQLG
jgi:hypothetical protein